MKNRTKRQSRNALDRLVASRVMGRTRLPRGWSPSTNYRDASGVVASSKKRSRIIAITHLREEGKWRVSSDTLFTSRGRLVFRHDGSFDSKSLPVAICMAALRAVKVGLRTIELAREESGL